jgi:uncharacterized protein YcbK (DUF882 family)
MYFKRREFNCSCCGVNKPMSNDFIGRLEEARKIAGVPFIVTSGYRCLANNLRVGGSPTSSHRRGVAADIAVTDSLRRHIIVSSLLRAGFNRIGISSTFIHVDYDLNKPANVMWVY